MDIDDPEVRMKLFSLAKSNKHLTGLVRTLREKQKRHEQESAVSRSRVEHARWLVDQVVGGVQTSMARLDAIAEAAGDDDKDSSSADGTSPASQLVKSIWDLRSEEEIPETMDASIQEILSKFYESLEKPYHRVLKSVAASGKGGEWKQLSNVAELQAERDSLQTTCDKSSAQISNMEQDMQALRNENDRLLKRLHVIQEASNSGTASAPGTQESETAPVKVEAQPDASTCGNPVEDSRAGNSAPSGSTHEMQKVLEGRLKELLDMKQELQTANARLHETESTTWLSMQITASPIFVALQEERDRWYSEYQILQEKLVAAHKEKEFGDKKCAQIRTELSQHWYDQIQHMHGRVSHEQGQKMEFQKQLADTKHELETLKEEIKARGSLEDMRKVNEMQKQELDRCLKQCEDLRQQVRSNEATIQSLKERDSRLTVQRDDLHAENQVLKQEGKRSLTEQESQSRLAKSHYEIGRLRKQIEQLQQQVKQEQKSTEQMVEQVTAVAQQFMEMQQQNKQLVDKIDLVESEKFAIQTQVHAFRKRNAELDQVVSKQHELVKAAQKLHHEDQKRIEETVKRAERSETAFAKLQDGQNALNEIVENHKAQVVEEKAKAQKQTTQSLQKDMKIGELERKVDDMARELSEARFAAKRAAETPRDECSTPGGRKSIRSDSEATLKRLREALQCGICKENYKDTVITRCYHTFCNDCIGARIRERRRKCPQCSQAFSESDVKKLWAV